MSTNARTSSLERANQEYDRTRFLAVLKAIPEGLQVYKFSVVLKKLMTSSVFLTAEREVDGGFESGALTECGPIVPHDVQYVPGFSPTIASSPVEVLGWLRNPSSPSNNDIVLQAEFVRIPGTQRGAALQQLRRFIDAHRDSNDQATQVAVAAAIRKYVANIDLAQFNDLASILDANNRSPPPIEVELEVAKTVHRNLQAFPPANCDAHPDLATRLSELVTAYVSPRFLTREKYGATAFSAVLALAALRSQLTSTALTAVASCGQSWFQEMVADSLKRLHAVWAVKSPPAAAWLERQLAGIPKSSSEIANA